MADDLAAPVQAVAHQVGVMFGGQGIHGNGSADAVLFQHVQQAEDAHPVAVFPVGQAGVVGKLPGRGTSGQASHLETAGGRLPFHVFQWNYDAQSNGGVVGPAQSGTADYGGPFVVGVIHTKGALGGHGLYSPVRWFWGAPITPTLVLPHQGGGDFNKGAYLPDASARRWA